jgi:hypothetical protein
MSNRGERRSKERGEKRGWTSKNGPWANAWSPSWQADSGQSDKEEQRAQRTATAGGDERENPPAFC